MTLSNFTPVITEVKYWLKLGRAPDITQRILIK